MNRKPIYITTPIYYVNDKPHIGHAYTTILADVLARFHRSAGEEVFFLTGLDEHGQKVQQAAEKRGVDPKTHCDEMAVRFIDLWEKLHIKYDDFIRTTQPSHKAVVQSVLQRVWDLGDIYSDEYEGWYSVAEERFITEKEKESGDFRDIRKLKEKNYFFRMGKYQEALLKHIEDHPQFIQPEHRKNEILGFLRQPLEDLCISRPKSRLSWGVDLPFDKDYVTYVWFDALINYITGIGFEQDDASYKKWWPATYHLIGKDILMTHAVYWPTMLLSAGIELPETIFAHGWWLTGDTKMSKSLGNVVNPLDLIDKYGVDPVRYYLMREMVLGQDADFSIQSFIKRYNSDLANDFGNLLSRVTRLIEKNFDGIIPQNAETTEAESELAEHAQTLGQSIQDLINSMRINEAIEQILQFVRAVNRYMEKQAPWKLVKNDIVRAGTVLYTAAEALRISAVHLHPVMPNRTKAVLDTLSANNSSWQWGELKSGQKLAKHDPLFPRIDIKKEKKAQTPDTPVNVITIEDFNKVHLKTAKVLNAEKVEGADRLLKLQIEVGKEKRQLVAGIAEFYSPESLVGKLIVIVANLKPATIRGLKSQGMLLAAKKGGKLTLITADNDQIESGARIS